MTPAVCCRSGQAADDDCQGCRMVSPAVESCAAPGCDAVPTWSVRASTDWLRVVAWLPVCDTHRDVLLARVAAGIDVEVVPW